MNDRRHLPAIETENTTPTFLPAESSQPLPFKSRSSRNTARSLIYSETFAIHSPLRNQAIVMSRIPIKMKSAGKLRQL